MKRGMSLILGFLILFIIIIDVINAEYASEILPKSELTKNIINDTEIKAKTQDIINNIIKKSSDELIINPNNEFQEMLYNLYHTNIDGVGEPKLIFDEEKPIIYIVPLMKEGVVVSFIELDPYTGKVLEYPGWNGNGETYLEVNDDFWLNLEENIAEEANIDFNEETRIVSIKNSPLSRVSYIVTPDISEEVKTNKMTTKNDSSPVVLSRVLINSFTESSPSIKINESPKIYSEGILENTEQNFEASKMKSNLNSFPEDFYPNYLIPDYDKLPLKNQLTSDSWVDYVNDNLAPVEEWNHPNDWWFAYYILGHKIANPWKCLSYSASSVADWFSIRQNVTLESYKSFTNGQTELGHNPRKLETMYHLRRISNPSLYKYALDDSEILQILATILGFGEKDPVTNEEIPYNINGYAEILKNPESFSNLGDLNFLNPTNNFRYSTSENEYLIEDYVEFPPTENNLKWALTNKGIVYAHLWPEYFSIRVAIIPIHAAVLVGYGEINGETNFLYHDSFGYDEPQYQPRTTDYIKKSIYFTPKEIQNASIICSQNSDCGIASSYDYCNGNNFCEVALRYTCNNPGTEQSHCANSINEECNPCSHGCNEVNLECNNEPSLELNINSPSKSLFNNRRIEFNLTVNQLVDEIRYIDNSDARPREKILCRRDCEGYGNDRVRLQSFNEGFHNITFKAIKEEVVVDEKTKQFIVDSKNPIITGENPKKGSFVNSSILFGYKFKEENPLISEMYINDVMISSKVPRYEAGDDFYFGQYLSYYDGQEIEYHFVLKDIANNSDESRHIETVIDTTPPILNTFNYSIDKRRVEFIFNVTELNFDEINYVDGNDRNHREKKLCSRLREDICDIRKSFSSGEHNLTITILDKAGNYIQEQANFVV